MGCAVSRVWFGTRAACTDAGTGLASRKGLVAHSPKAVRCPQSTALKRGRPPSGTQSTLTRLGLRLISATLLILRYCAMSFYKGDRAFLPLLDHLSGSSVPRLTRVNAEAGTEQGLTRSLHADLKIPQSFSPCTHSRPTNFRYSGSESTVRIQPGFLVKISRRNTQR